jgi:hypothetical protein
MLSDKIVVVSSINIYRRIKDLYDLSVLASLGSLKLSDVRKTLKRKHPDVELANMLIQENYGDLCHAYDRYSGILNKPDIELLIAFGNSFLHPIYSNHKGELIWEPESARWKTMSM